MGDVIYLEDFLRIKREREAERDLREDLLYVRELIREINEYKESPVTD